MSGEICTCYKSKERETVRMCVGVGLEASCIMLVQSTQVLHRMHQCKKKKNLLASAHTHNSHSRTKSASIKVQLIAIAEILTYSLETTLSWKTDFMRHS